jgi:O-antigen ligase
MRRYRILSLTCAVLLLFAGASLYAARSSQQYQLRGATALFPQPVHGAEALLMGVNASLEQYDVPTLNARLADLSSRGVHYVRQEFRWTDMEPVRGQFDWSMSDRVFDAAHRNRVQVLPVLLTTPAWARAATGSVQMSAPETMPPQDVAGFATFAHAFAQRYDRVADGFAPILAYQVWDEPNLSAGWGNGLVNPVGYLRLLRAARSAIQDVNPAARIVLAGLAPTVEQSDVNLSSYLYLRKLYEAGGRDAFDIVATKPYGFDLPTDDRRVSAETMNFSRVILVREEMVAHGDAQKAIWMTQWGWNAQLPNWQGDASIWGKVNESEQAQYTTRAIERAAREWNWAGAMFLYTLQPHAEATNPLWGFALLDQQGKPRPVYAAFTTAVSEAIHAPRAQWAAVPAGPTSPVAMNVSTTVAVSNTGPYEPNAQAMYSPGWRFSELGADIPQREDAQVTFTFAGDELAMIVRRDDYRAYMFITIDGRPANLLPQEARGNEHGSYLIMTSPDRLPHIDTIPVANGLGAGEHTAVVKMDRGWNQWALVGWSSRTAEPPSIALAATLIPVLAVLLVLCVVGLLFSLPRAQWGEVLRRSAPNAETRVFSWQALLAALVVWLTASLTWAQEASSAYHNLGTPANLVITGVVAALAFWSPVFVLSLLALAVLFVLVLWRLDIGLLLLAFFIPFYLTPQRIFAKAFPMVELLTFMCAASWTLQKVRGFDWRNLRGTRKNIRLLLAQFSLLDWGILALVVVASLSALQADFKVEALRELRMVFIEPALVFLMLRSIQLDDRQVWRITDGFVLGAVIIALIGLFNYARGDVFPAEFGFPRIRSVYGSPNNDALYLGRALPLLLAVTLFGATSGARLRWLNRRLLYGVGLLFVAVALFLSASRGALLLGMPAAFIAMCLVGGGRWRYVGVILLALSALALMVLLSGVATPYLEGTRFANALDLTRGTGFFRVNLWQSALRMWQDHFWLGVGPDNFLYAYRGFYILPAAWQEPNLSHPHNMILDFATRLGLLGLLAGVSMAAGLFITLRRGWQDSKNTPLRPLAIGLVGFFADMTAHGMVDHSLFVVDLAFVFMLACGLSWQVASQSAASTRSYGATAPKL